MAVALGSGFMAVASWQRQLGFRDVGTHVTALWNMEICTENDLRSHGHSDYVASCPRARRTKNARFLEITLRALSLFALNDRPTALCWHSLESYQVRAKSAPTPRFAAATSVPHPHFREAMSTASWMARTTSFGIRTNSPVPMICKRSPSRSVDGCC